MIIFILSGENRARMPPTFQVHVTTIDVHTLKLE